ncbi:hypothetical protein AB3X52_17270 [Nocardioides sp. DS6]|uniref:Sulfotransferase family protein n=1 Tax=Nocardioides eburneus TaxID=3231482 RepID=A0ABV3T2D2_9ACTN
MADEVFIHLGLPKTGTTYLQTILWNARDQLRADGLLLPGQERRDHLWASREVREDPNLHRLPARAATAWQRLRDEIAVWSGRALISHEFFAAASAEQAARMVDALAPARVHLVVTARDPLGLFAASWQESLKNRGTTPMERYSRKVSANPLDVWNWRTLDLRLVLERWAPAVPAERVHVLPLDTSAPRDDVWHRFGGVLGLDTTAYDLSMSFPNESMGVVEAETLRRVNQQLDSADVPYAFQRAFDRGVYLRTFLADERLVPRRGERFWPRADRIAECRERGEAAVAHVREHGYDVVGDLERLLVPETLPERRTPDSVTDAEVADAATWLVARMLADVRELREGGAASPPPTDDAAVSRRRGWWRGR